MANTIAGRKTFRKQLGDLEDVPIGALTPMHFREWEYQLRNGRPWRDGKPLAETTVNGYVREMRSMLTTAVNEERIRRNPARNLKARKSPDASPRRSAHRRPRQRHDRALRNRAAPHDQGRTLCPARRARRVGGMNAVPEMAYPCGWRRRGQAVGVARHSVGGYRCCPGTVHLRGTKSDAVPRTITLADAIKAMRRRAAEYPTKEGFVMMC